MYQHFIKDSTGAIDSQLTIINILNSLPLASKAITNFNITTQGPEHLFAISFNNPATAAAFHATHKELGSLDLKDPASPKIVLNDSDNFIYLFNKVIDSKDLLTNPAVPPAFRVNLMELFAKQLLTPYIFHGPRTEDMKVDFNPIKFKDGKLDLTLRGQLLGNNNTLIDFEDFDKLALISLTTTQSASHISALKQLLFAVRKNYILHSPKLTSTSQKQLASSLLKISSFDVDPTRKKLFLSITNSLKSSYTDIPTVKDLREYKKLLSDALGEKFEVKSSLNNGYSSLEIKPAGKVFFTAQDVDELNTFFSTRKDDICSSFCRDPKLFLFSALIATGDEVYYSFEDIPELSQAFRDPISYVTVQEPIVIGTDGHSFSSSIVASVKDNPLTRAPIESIRENKLLAALLTYYSQHEASSKPPLLQGIDNAVILPNGDSYDLNILTRVFMEQNKVTTDQLKPEHKATLDDGTEVAWNDLWPNRAVQELIEFYNISPTLSHDRRVIEHPDNPLLGLSATVSCLIQSENNLSHDEAEQAMLKNELPIQVIWSSEPAGLRMNFTNGKYAQEIIRLLNSKGITAEYNDASNPYKGYIYISGANSAEKDNIKTFLFDVCNYNQTYRGFAKFFDGSDFRAESAPRKKADKQNGGAFARLRRTAGAAAASSALDAKEVDTLVLDFLHAMFYKTMPEVTSAYEKLPSNLKHGRLALQDGNSNATGDMLARAPSGAHTATALTPADMLAHILPGHGGGYAHGLPMPTPLPLAAPGLGGYGIASPAPTSLTPAPLALPPAFSIPSGPAYGLPSAGAHFSAGGVAGAGAAIAAGLTTQPAGAGLGPLLTTSYALGLGPTGSGATAANASVNPTASTGGQESSSATGAQHRNGHSH